jgi:hypothetical protein
LEIRSSRYECVSKTSHSDGSVTDCCFLRIHHKVWNFWTLWIFDVHKDFHKVGAGGVGQQSNAQHSAPGARATAASASGSASGRSALTVARVISALSQPNWSVQSFSLA